MDYCSGYLRNDNKSACPKRFDCQLFSNFHIAGSQGKFKNMDTEDIYNDSVYDHKKATCVKFKTKENA